MPAERPRLTAHLLRQLYMRGMFPMAHDGALYVHDPDPRAIFPLHTLRPNARLLRYFRSHGYTCTMDTAFAEVMRACADRPDQWISEEMVEAYTALHREGNAISAEVWQEGEMVGGLYGVKLGRAFFGESMFSLRTNAGKAAFYHIVEHLRANDFTLFDTQYINEHTRSLGAVEVPREEFRRMLAEAVV